MVPGSALVDLPWGQLVGHLGTPRLPHVSPVARSAGQLQGHARTVTVPRSLQPWPDGYFHRLIGCRVAFMLDERGVYGTLTAVVETEDEFTLTFEDPRVED